MPRQGHDPSLMSHPQTPVICIPQLALSLRVEHRFQKGLMGRGFGSIPFLIFPPNSSFSNVCLPLRTELQGPQSQRWFKSRPKTLNRLQHAVLSSGWYHPNAFCYYQWSHRIKRNTWTLVVLYRLTLATPANTLPVCSDVRAAEPGAKTSLLDLSYNSGIISHQKGKCNTERQRNTGLSWTNLQHQCNLLWQVIVCHG